jgi:S1-C subfamily serine protease
MFSKRMVGLTLLGLLIAGAAIGQTSSGQAGSRQPKVFIGVAVEPTEENAKHAGAVVRSVSPDSPAAKAGIKEGDIIDKVAGKDVKDFESLLGTLARHRPGEQVTFRVMRDGQEKEIAVTLGQRPMGFGGGILREGGAFLGVQTQPLTAQMKEKLNVTADKGVVVTDVLPNTPASKAGLQRDDVITSLAGRNVADPMELRDAVHAAGTGKDVDITILRGQEKKELHVRLEESPVDGLTRFPTPFQGNLVTPLQEAVERAAQLQRRVEDLERRVRELEQNRK